MRKITVPLIFIALIVFSSGIADPATTCKKKYTLSQYIDTFKTVAVEEMDRSGIPASVTLSQAILESGYGN
ncbi:MAG: N-acetylmuramoyl-L-alanine amidase, partial [Bacteroidota bacterium]